MKPILLIHGYSSEGKNNTAEDIYGSLPADLRAAFGDDVVKEIDLSRWISLSDGVSLDDVSFAMDRALRSKPFRSLLETGFNVVIHSTGALVVRNWIRLFSARPCPIDNLVHLAGANFGSGLAHIGRGQLARWGRLIFQGTGRGEKVLNELEFGSSKTLDLHLHFLREGNDMREDYQVQEFCLAGSQTLGLLRVVPIRYVKEDSSDNTVRTSAANLNYNYLTVTPSSTALQMSKARLAKLLEKRLADERIMDSCYSMAFVRRGGDEPQVPYAVVYDTAHFGGDIGIVSGKDNRKAVMPLLTSALATPYDTDAYEKTALRFQRATAATFKRVAGLKIARIGWNKQSQYEGHAQLIFRLRDQHSHPVESFDINIKSTGSKSRSKLEHMIEDHHSNKRDKGTITFYLRTQRFEEQSRSWRDLMDTVSGVDLEITGHEPGSDEISYVPVNVRLSSSQVRATVQGFRTTIIDVTLARLPSNKVFSVSKV